MNKSLVWSFLSKSLFSDQSMQSCARYILNFSLSFPSLLSRFNKKKGNKWKISYANLMVSADITQGKVKVENFIVDWQT